MPKSVLTLTAIHPIDTDFSLKITNVTRMEAGYIIRAPIEYQHLHQISQKSMQQLLRDLTENSTVVLDAKFDLKFIERLTASSLNFRVIHLIAVKI